MLLFDPMETWKQTKLVGGTYRMRELMIQVFKDGRKVYDSPNVMELQKICKEELESLWPETKRLSNPHEVYVDLSKKLWDMKDAMLRESHEA